MTSTSISLLRRLREPDRGDAWERFVEIYTPLLHYWALRTGLSSPDAADLVQEVFVTLVRTLPSFDYDQSQGFRSWLRTIVMNKWRDFCRRKAARPEQPAGDVAPVVSEAKLSDLWEAEHRQLLVKRALEVMQAEFEERTWRACWLTTVDSLPASQAAAQLGISENAVYIAKTRVLRRLREELADLL
jgi:RNA polymerase sigma-70 factor (ECF subfamily)